jgi:hypothetical protein
LVCTHDFDKLEKCMWTWIETAGTFFFETVDTRIW